MPTGITIKEYKAKQTEDSLVYISGYKNLSFKALFRCKLCDNTFEQWPKQALRGCCKFCRGNKIRVHRSKDALIDLPEDPKFTGHYDENHKPIWRCANGHEYAKAAHAIKRAGCCTKCSHTAYWDRNKVSKKEATSILAERNLILLKYKNEKLTFMCKHGHKKTLHANREKLEIVECQACIKLATRARQLEQKFGNKVLKVHENYNADIKCGNCGTEYTYGVNDKRGHCPSCYAIASKVGIEEWNVRYKERGLDLTILSYTDGKYKLVCSKGHITHLVGLGNFTDCPKCSKSNLQYSRPHRKLLTWIEKHGFSVNKDDRDIVPSIAIDIFVPEKNIAIEVDGVYWHSERRGENANKRLLRRKLVEDKNVRLLRFWDYELERPKAVGSYLLSVLGKHKYSVGARKCEVRKLKTASEFFETWHIQGDTKASKTYGLFYNNELIAAMSFRKPSISNKYEWELARFCVKGNYSIPGGASRLFNAFVKEVNPKNVVTYADKRYSVGSVYLSMGFTYSHDSAPGYFYFGSLGRISRYRAQKHKLKDLLEDFDPAKSEVENMRAHGNYRSFDDGQKIFYWGAKPKFNDKVPVEIIEKVREPSSRYGLTWEAHIESLTGLKVLNPSTGVLRRNERIDYKCLRCGHEFESYPSLAINITKGGCAKCANSMLLREVKQRIKENNPDFAYVCGYVSATHLATFKHLPTGIVFEERTYSIITGRFPHSVKRLIKELK